MRKEEPNTFIIEVVMKVSCYTPWWNNIICRAQKAHVYCVSLKPVASNYFLQDFRKSKGISYMN